MYLINMQFHFIQSNIFDCSEGCLQSLIDKQGRLSEHLTKIFTAQILSALIFIHGNNIKHRDLKPQNIMLNENYHVKIIDFGDANYIEQQADSREIEDNNDDYFNQEECGPKGTFVGTPLYASPEMLQGNESSAATDLWALGCILYQMLFGKVPFQAKTDLDTFNLIIRRELKFPDDIDVSEDAIDLISQLLSIMPHLRGHLDYPLLLSHPFFTGINFTTLSEIDIKSLLSAKQPLSRKNSWVDLNDELGDSDQHEIVWKGVLKKRTSYKMSQQRTFVLYMDGRLEYYKDEVLYRGVNTINTISLVYQIQKFILHACQVYFN